MDEEWGPWTVHDGSGMPVSPDTIVEAYDMEGDFYEAMEADTLGWEHSEEIGLMGWIVRYRVLRPRGLTILEEIAKGIREPVDA